MPVDDHTLMCLWAAFIKSRGIINNKGKKEGRELRGVKGEKC